MAIEWPACEGEPLTSDSQLSPVKLGIRESRCLGTTPHVASAAQKLSLVMRSSCREVESTCARRMSGSGSPHRSRLVGSLHHLDIRVGFMAGIKRATSAFRYRCSHEPVRVLRPAGDVVLPGQPRSGARRLFSISLPNVHPTGAPVSSRSVRQAGMIGVNIREYNLTNV